MRVQDADGSLFPGVKREEYFRFENPLSLGTIFLRNCDGVAGDVQLLTAPEDVSGGPGAFTVRATVTLAGYATGKFDLPADLAPAGPGEVFLKILPLAGKVEYHISSLSAFHYTRDAL